MATDITSKPVPDYSYEVARRNLEDLDKLENQTSGTFQNRAGKVITPIPVVNDRLEELTSSLESLEQEFVAGIASTGYFPVAGSFETGSTITARNQYLQLITTVGSDLAGGYTWGGAIPEGGLVIPAGSTPSSTGGQSPGAWVWRSDTTVRSDLANGTADVGGAKASDLAKATINVSNLKALASIPVGERRTDITYQVLGFNAATNIGGFGLCYDADYVWTSADIGLVYPDVALNAWDGTAAGIATLYGSHGSGTGAWVRLDKPDIFSVGAIASEPFDVVMKRMLELEMPIDGDHGYFYCANSLSHTGSATVENITLEFKSGGITFNATTNPWLSCTETKVYSGAISGIEVAGINCSKLTFPSPPALSVWDVVTVGSDAQYPWIHFESKAGQRAVVIKVTGNEVLLDRELEAGYTYNKVTKYSDDTLKLDMVMLNKNDLPSGVSGSLLTVTNYKSADVKVKALESYYQIITCLGLFDSDIRLNGKKIRNYSPDQSKFGYGIVDRACQSCHFHVDVRSLRHGYTTTHGGSGTEPHRYGEPRDNVVSGRGVNCVTPFDTHLNATNIIYRDATAIGSYGSGFSVRGRDCTLENCHADGFGDSAFFIFSNSNPSVTVGRGGVTTLNNCTSKNYKRFVRVGHQREDTNTARSAFRFTVNLNDCSADTKMYSETIYAFNSKIIANNLTIRDESTIGSVTELTYNESNPIFLRGFVSLISSEFIGTNVNFVKKTNAQKVYPFILESRKSLNAAAFCNVNIEGLDLDNKLGGLFTEWGELIVTSTINGKKPSDGALDYTAGLESTYCSFEGVGASVQNRENMARVDVLAYYKARATSAGYFGWTPAIAKNPNYAFLRSLFLDGNAIVLDGSVDNWNLTEKTIDMRGDVSSHAYVRVSFRNDGAGAGELRISGLINQSNAHNAQTIQIMSTNGSATRLASVANGVAAPNDITARQRGLVATLWCETAINWVRVKY